MLITGDDTLICRNEGLRVRQGHYDAKRSGKVGKLKKREAGACKSRRVGLRLT